MVACKGELGKLLLDYEIVQILLVRKLVTEAEAVIEEAEAYSHPSFGCFLQKIDS